MSTTILRKSIRVNFSKQRCKEAGASRDFKGDGITSGLRRQMSGEDKRTGNRDYDGLAMTNARRRQKTGNRDYVGIATTNVRYRRIEAGRG